MQNIVIVWNIYLTHITWENEDKKSADSPNNTDDLADVWHKYGNEQRHHYPQHRHNVTAPALQLQGRRAIRWTPAPQQVVLDHRPEEQQRKEEWAYNSSHDIY